jgi:hypothetical protein
MISATQKKAIHLSIIIILLFIGLGLVFYYFIIYFPATLRGDKHDLRFTSPNFSEKLVPRLLAIEKYCFLVLSIIFIASLAFSKRLQQLVSSLRWSGLPLLVCRLFFFISMVANGIGMAWLINWPPGALPAPAEDTRQLFELSSIYFNAAGSFAGLALAGMLIVCIISFIQQINFSADDDWVTEYVHISEP